MKKIISTEKKPIKLWLKDIEAGAFQQAKNIANLPFTFRHVAMMPDCHEGYGMPIGGVLATEKVIIPNAVGVDIGCGMCALRTNLKEIKRGQLMQIHMLINEKVPVGFRHHKKKQNQALMPDFDDTMFIVNQQYEKALHQLGTLGGGNHFIEIQKGSDGFIWIMVHSGSRNIGKRVADHYNNVAKNLNKLWFSVVKKETQLAFLPLNTQEAQNYFKEMQFCVDFALSNRRLMMERVQQTFIKIMGKVDFDNFVNIAHNYAKLENHYNTNVIVHRKGATSAKKGEKGIIPGSQGTKSYIVEGLGCEESFMSCSHGAGRVMGRKQAIRTLDLQAEIKKMDDLNIIHGIKKSQDLEEASTAYKDIDVVMENQKDLVKKLVELSPLAVVKG